MDAREFQDLAAEGRRHEAQGRLQEALTFFQQAAELYGGDFLSEELYQPWAEHPRRVLREVYLDILTRMAAIHERQGSLTRALKNYHQVMQADPLNDLAGQRLMLLYARRGRKSAALQVYEDLRRALKQELDAEPDEVTRAVYHKIFDK